MTIFDNTVADDHPYPFTDLVSGSVVTLKERHGLYEALEEGSDGRWSFRALSIEGKPLVTAGVSEMTAFDLPIYYCLASRHPGEIVALVSGPDFDVSYNDPAVAAPLFQKVHSADLIKFCELALAAGFSTIELTNGYVPWEGSVEDLIEVCRAHATGTPA